MSFSIQIQSMTEELDSCIKHTISKSLNHTIMPREENGVLAFTASCK